MLHLKQHAEIMGVTQQEVDVHLPIDHAVLHGSELVHEEGVCGMGHMSRARAFT